MAGLTASSVVIPKAMALATVAGLPLEVGLYTAMVPMAIYAVLGSARQLSVSTTTIIAILTAGALNDVLACSGSRQLMTGASTLALLAGCFLVLAFLLRLGFMAYYR